MVVTFGILFAVMARENIVACASEAVGTHSAIVLAFVGGLSVTRKTHDHQSGRDICIVDDVAALGFCDQR